MQLKKYQGDPKTEGLHIEINRVNALITEARRKRALVHGDADRGIQAMQKQKSTPTTGKYWARRVHHEESETIQDPNTGKWINTYGRNLPKAGERLPASGEYETEAEASKAASERSRLHTEPDVKIFGPQLPRDMKREDGPMLNQSAGHLLEMQSFNATLELARDKGADALSERNLQHPEFQKAFERTSLYAKNAAKILGGEIPPSFQVAGMPIGASGGNTSQNQQLQSLKQQEIEGAPPTLKPLDATLSPLSASPPIWSDAEKSQRLGKGSLGQKFKAGASEPAQPKSYSDSELRKMGLK